MPARWSSWGLKRRIRPNVGMKDAESWRMGNSKKEGVIETRRGFEAENPDGAPKSWTQVSKSERQLEAKSMTLSSLNAWPRSLGVSPTRDTEAPSRLSELMMMICGQAVVRDWMKKSSSNI